MDVGPSKRTRVVNGCQACRSRHVKCEPSDKFQIFAGLVLKFPGDDRVPSCESCTKDGIACVRATNVRFRGINKSISGTFAFPEDQTWVQVDRRLTYLDETTRVIRCCNAGKRKPQSCSTVGDLEDRDFYDSWLTRNNIFSIILYNLPPLRDFRTSAHVPRRAFYHATLRYAIFAFSSRHINRHRRGQESTEALEYYDKCLNLLIPAISNPNHHVTEEVFAAVAILRQYEEMDSEDRGLHLTGTTRIVNSMRGWGFTPGLREASSWLCLRQDIYISMVQESPLKTDLDAFLQSDIYTRSDDTAYAARIVVIVARILIGTSAEDLDSRTRVLNEARAELEEWYDSKPSTFTPTWSGSGNGDPGRLPEIWMLLPCHAIILFALSEPATQKSGYNGLRENRRRERKADQFGSIQGVVRKNLRTIVGLANSNQGAENLLFMARHALSVWGGVLVDKADQEAVKTFLRHMQQTTSWNTEPMIASLQEQWDEF
ncbi:hypothetical protein J7T55_001080 [Diaporthe amygdali]|uniref:uncharacterized protein n=1 Tax=Phomopsis amygdali TaxID=1214568 RepID=UPI0022FE4244|nr:uncharacterized protein J7T55_001080 [Diaporthe amygdali]KAJ0120223.1 hypothetical protein J7T55_001080 [Diaporthe amygdali]